MNDILKIISENPNLKKITEHILDDWKTNYKKKKNTIG
jgi:hypothetical protein